MPCNTGGINSAEELTAYTFSEKALSEGIYCLITELFVRCMNGLGSVVRI